MADNGKRTVPSLWSSDPFADFRKQMDHLFEDFLGRPGALTPAGADVGALQRMVSPAIEVSENDKAITLTAELPGMAEDDVEVHVRDGVLTLKGEKKVEKTEEDENRYFSERRYGSFQRSMSLPERIDEAKIAAKFDKGVLHVTMPKRADAKPSARKIDISG